MTRKTIQERRRGPAALTAVTLASALVLSGCFGAAGRGGDGAAGDAAGDGGGTAVLAMLQEPGSMNPLFSVEGATALSIGPVLEPLFVADAEGVYQPGLAQEVPTVDNGGLSADGLTMTVQLREGITWSDGTPLTAEDLVFTFDVLRDPGSAVVAQPAYEPVDSVTATDDRTVEITMSRINPLREQLFSAILPAHRFTSTAVAAGEELARLPLGTGPFVYTEWRSGDQLAMQRNPDYWRDPSLPVLDGITWQMVPDRSTAVTAFSRGEYDSVWFLGPADLTDLAAPLDDGTLATADNERLGLPEWIWFNHSDPANRDLPHPVLSDLAVRTAIDLAMNRQAIIDTVLGGNAEQVAGMLSQGQYACDIEPTPFDPEQARQLLDDAGWVPGPDGVRVRDGVRAALRFTTISGNASRELNQQLIQDNLADIGIEIRIDNSDSNIIFAGFSGGGRLATGDYDIFMSLDGLRSPHPSDFVGNLSTASRPGPDNDAGFTYTHWNSPEFDALVAQAAVELDSDAAGATYAQACALFRDQRVSVPLFAAPEVGAWSSRLEGVGVDYWSGMWQNPSVAEWRLSD